MSDTPEGLMVVQITRDKALVWSAGVAPGSVPRAIRAPSEKSHHVHSREAQHLHDRDTDDHSTAFFESVSSAIAPASAIVLVGHGKGKANEMLHLTQYLERKHPAIAAHVVGAIDSDLDELSEAQVLALVRERIEE